MSKRKAAIEEAAAIAEGVSAAHDWCYPGENKPPDFYDYVALIRGLRQVMTRFPPDAPKFLEAGRIRIQKDEFGWTDIYLRIGGFQEKA